MRMPLLLVVLCCLTIGTAFPTSVVAQALWSPDSSNQTPRADEPDRVPLELTPAGEPVPAMKYRLLPTREERTPGNATTNYYRALLHYQAVPQDWKKKEVDNPSWLEDRPLDDAIVAEIKNYLEVYDNAFAELKTAVYREECEWDLGLERLRGPEVVMYLLHDFQEMRAMARLLDLRFRVELHENRLDDAWETLRQMTQLGIDTARPPLLINGLIGIAIESIMLHRLEEFISHPDAPNVYWALAALPEPLIDLGPSIEFEMSMGTRMFPLLDDPERPRTPEQWQAELAATYKTLRDVGGMQKIGGNTSEAPDLLEGAAALGYAVTRYPKAKEVLLEAGYSAEEVDAMPVGQILTLAEKSYYKRIADELLKIYYLPMHERIDRANELEERIDSLMKNEPLPIASLLLPAVNAAGNAQNRLVFRVRGLQTIEAIRQAALASGSLPRRLQEVTELPPALDPYRMENFSYESNGRTANLRVIVPNVPATGSSKIYELTLRPAR